VTSDGRPEWNDAAAEKLIGASVLIGLTIIEPNGDIEQQQMFGFVESVDSKEGISIALAGSRRGEIYVLPPDLRGFARARPGSYRLRSTGETIESPDYMSTWTITRPGSPPVS
jgi:hypothetical protein